MGPQVPPENNRSVLGLQILRQWASGPPTQWLFWSYKSPTMGPQVPPNAIRLFP
ncbi:Hypothetical protein FKW44_010021 [Caligus rogercresseyi]|uniref:Uncharacterized protein n=1 Tax=Caligus rogercresseyi TaxID=217165 RepID=A0A7T8HG52_CALRO|nr:Hypothetical protein FKW44_010021 [Caligus rogercresseyi]